MNDNVFYLRPRAPAVSAAPKEHSAIVVAASVMMVFPGLLLAMMLSGLPRDAGD